MSIEINENEHIIVYVVYHGNRNWYISDKEIWFLDHKKRIEAYKKIGYEIKEEYIDERRRNLLILNSDNAIQFLEQIEDAKVTTDELRTALLEYRKMEKNERAYKFSPCLYVNFDSKQLYSMCSEDESFEDYAPMGWKANFLDFLKYIPEEYRYWENNSGNLLIGGYK